MSSQSGVSVSPQCIEAFNELKLGKSVRYVIYKLSDDYKEVVVEETSNAPDYEVFRSKLENAKVKDRSGNDAVGPRYAVYDFEYEMSSGEGKRSKILFVSWIPNDTPVKPRMTYASSKDALKRALNGIAMEIQANDGDDIEHAAILSKVTKSAR